MTSSVSDRGVGFGDERDSRAATWRAVARRHALGRWRRVCPQCRSRRRRAPGLTRRARSKAVVTARNSHRTCLRRDDRRLPPRVGWLRLEEAPDRRRSRSSDRSAGPGSDRCSGASEARSRRPRRRRLDGHVAALSTRVSDARREDVDEARACRGPPTPRSRLGRPCARTRPRPERQAVAKGSCQLSVDRPTGREGDRLGRSHAVRHIRAAAVAPRRERVVELRWPAAA